MGTVTHIRIKLHRFLISGFPITARTHTDARTDADKDKRLLRRIAGVQSKIETRRAADFHQSVNYPFPSPCIFPPFPYYVSLFLSRREAGFGQSASRQYFLRNYNMNLCLPMNTSVRWLEEKY